MSSDKLLSIISGKDFDEEALLEMLFNQYRIARDKKVVYNDEDHVPQNLIKMYYKSSSHSEFKDIYELFKKRYSSQESRLEDVHSKKEIEGLGLVYDYIRNDEWKSMSNIFVILRLNSILFSQTPYPEAGGKFRDSDCYLLGSGINTCPYKDIIVEINKLNPAFVELLNYGIELGLNNDSSNEDNLIDYINRCIELKCKIVKIHPFNDGNGRTARALVNLLFKTAGLPPIYIKLSEREKYLEAMNKAINEEDYNPINKFYYYKICDSILELDIANRTKGSSEELNNPLKKVRKPETKKN